MPEALLPIFQGIEDEPAKVSPKPKSPEKPTPPKPPQRSVRKVVRKSLDSLGTPSIKDALQGKFKEEEQTLSAKEQFKLHTSVKDEESFTDKDMERVWKAFLVRLDDRPNLKSTLSKLPELKENYTLYLEIDNSIQEENILSIKPELLSYLRKELKNSKIEFITRVSEEIKNRVIYTDQDKFDELLKKNASLGELKKKFNLDFGEI